MSHSILLIKDVMKINQKINEVKNNLILELRRGTLVMSVLSQLQKPQYGYSLVQLLTNEGLTINQSTLYPLLRRLEKQELLDSEWVLEDTRPRRYYVINDNGKLVLSSLAKEWKEMNNIILSIMENKEI